MTQEKEVFDAPEETEVAPELTFVLTIQQSNIILAALDEVPHKLSRTIIDSLQKQAAPQLARNKD